MTDPAPKEHPAAFRNTSPGFNVHNSMVANLAVLGLSTIVDRLALVFCM